MNPLCYICDQPILRVCVHPGCTQPVPFLCEHKCKLGLNVAVLCHTHNQETLFSSYDNIKESIRLMQTNESLDAHLNSVRDRIRAIKDRLDTMFSSYQGDLHQIKHRINTKTQAVIRQFMQPSLHIELTGSQMADFIRGDSLYDNQQNI